MTAKNRYDQIVSLGRACQPAHQIKRVVPHAISHVFDWIVTTDAGLVDWVQSDLDGMFDRDRLELGPENCIIDRETQTQFLHEFPSGSDFAAQFEKNAGRYAMLADRWRDLLSSGQSILFVRQHGWDNDPRACAIKLRDAIAAKAPKVPFQLLYLTRESHEAWDEDRITNRQLKQPEPYVWTGDDAAWDEIFASAVA